MNESANFSLPDPLYVELGQFSIFGLLAPGQVTTTQKRNYKFASIQFQVINNVVGAPVLSFEISSDGTNFRACTFAESANTANVNSVTTPPLGYIGIVTVKPLYWRFRVVGAGTFVIVKVIGLN